MSELLILAFFPKINGYGVMKITIFLIGSCYPGKILYY